ncbi:CX chemokine ligand 34c precursor [Danio rerio]|uniref:CX chemokine ligand 34c precursor n=1 Tax=Danio rerio TaxID=7955 RepID=A0AB13A9A2_DANRE|nr:CX chemokine ligand 34c precursor [Danio rerio]
MRLSSASHQMIVSSGLLLLLCVFTSGVFIPESDRIQDTSSPNKNVDARPSLCFQVLTTVEPRKNITSCYNLSKKGNCLQCVLFVDAENRMMCMDPNASWLPARLNRLKAKGVTCKEWS